MVGSLDSRRYLHLGYVTAMANTVTKYSIRNLLYAHEPATVTAIAGRSTAVSILHKHVCIRICK